MAVTNYYTVEGEIIGEQRPGEADSRDYVLDYQGNVVLVLQNDWGRAEASYDPYGQFLGNWDMSNYRFSWHAAYGYRTTNTEWSSHYVRARHYAFMDGAWTTVDPLWPHQMPYGYVEGRVMSAVDPSGQKYTHSNCSSYMKSTIADITDVLDRFCSAIAANPSKLRVFLACAANRGINTKGMEKCLKKWCSSGTYYCGDCKGSEMLEAYVGCRMKDRVTCSGMQLGQWEYWVVRTPAAGAETDCNSGKITMCWQHYAGYLDGESSYKDNCEPGTFKVFRGDLLEMSIRSWSYKKEAGASVIHELLHKCGDCQDKHGKDYKMEHQARFEDAVECIMQFL